MKKIAQICGPLGAFLSMIFSASLAQAANCVTDAEIEAAVGADLRASTFAVETDMLGDRPLCSGLTMVQAVQRLHSKYFPAASEGGQEAPKALAAPKAGVTEASAGSGRIWGELSYASDYIPYDIMACAEDVASDREVCVKRSVVQGRSTFYSVIGQPGRYQVYARSQDAPGKKAYYSQSVICGKGSGGEGGCTDHTPVVLTVTHGSVHSGVNS